MEHRRDYFSCSTGSKFHLQLSFSISSLIARRKHDGWLHSGWQWITEPVFYQLKPLTPRDVAESWVSPKLQVPSATLCTSHWDGAFPVREAQAPSFTAGLGSQLRWWSPQPLEPQNGLGWKGASKISSFQLFPALTTPQSCPRALAGTYPSVGSSVIFWSPEERLPATFGLELCSVKRFSCCCVGVGLVMDFVISARIRGRGPSFATVACRKEFSP